MVITAVSGAGVAPVDGDPMGVESALHWREIVADSGQTYKNHTRFFPLFHFFVAPILLINVLVRAYRVYSVPSRLDAWELVIAITLVGLALAARVMALAVQDRVI